MDPGIEYTLMRERSWDFVPLDRIHHHQWNIISKKNQASLQEIQTLEEHA